MKPKILFEEKQSFVGTWIWYLILIIAALSIGGAIVGSFMITKEAEGTIGLSIAAIVTIALVVLFYRSRLSVVIDNESIRYRYPPFVNTENVIQKNDLNDLYTRSYNSLIEYGGWGYRYSLKNGRVLNIVGGEGLQIIGKNDKKILIGTQKPDQLKYAVRKLKENWGMKNAK